MNELKDIIESLLFVAEEPMTLAAIKSVVDIAETGEIREAIHRLLEEYDSRKGGFYLREIAGGYQFRTRPEHNDWIKRMLKPSPQRLSKASLETLAIIAYKQPVIRSDIEHIRGVDCGGVLRMLMERKLIRILGRKEIPGRPLIYATTKQFLEVFHLRDLRDLPSPKEIEELSRTADETSGDMPTQATLPFDEEAPMDDMELEEDPQEGTPDEIAHQISSEVMSETAPQGSEETADPHLPEEAADDGDLEIPRPSVAAPSAATPVDTNGRQAFGSESDEVSTGNIDSRAEAPAALDTSKAAYQSSNTVDLDAEKEENPDDTDGKSS